MSEENKTNEPKKDDAAENEDTPTSAKDAICSSAPDKEKCEEFVEKRLGEASNNIDRRS